jgi:chromosome segregation ATPase
MATNMAEPAPAAQISSIQATSTPQENWKIAEKKINTITDMLGRCRTTETLYLQKHAEMTAVWNAYIQVVRNSYAERARIERERHADQTDEQQAKDEEQKKKIKALENEITKLNANGNVSQENAVNLKKLVDQLNRAIDKGTKDEDKFLGRLNTIEDEQRIMLHNVSLLYDFPRTAIAHGSDDPFLMRLLKSEDEKMARIPRTDDRDDHAMKAFFPTNPDT